MRSSSEHGQDLFFDHVSGGNLLTWWLFFISFMELLLPWTWIESRFNLSCEAFGRTNYVCISKVRVIETCHCWLFHCFLVLCISHEVQIFFYLFLLLFIFIFKSAKTIQGPFLNCIVYSVDREKSNKQQHM